MSDSCQVTIQPTQGGYVVRVEGRGTMRVSPAVRDFVCGALDDGARIVMDLSCCEYLDSTFLGCLVLLHKRRTNADEFSVMADKPTREKLMGEMQLHRLLDFTDDCPRHTGEEVTLLPAELERSEFCRHLIETHEKLADLGGPGAETFRRIAQQLCDEMNS